METQTKRKKKCVYDERKKESTLKYMREKTHGISLRYKTEEFEGYIRPAISRSGLPVNSFIRAAVLEKIEREGLTL